MKIFTNVSYLWRTNDGRVGGWAHPRDADNQCTLLLPFPRWLAKLLGVEEREASKCPYPKDGDTSYPVDLQRAPL